MSTELDDLLSALQRHRGFLRESMEGLSHEQAGERPTVSELCVGGLVKHVARTEQGWVRFAVHGEEDAGPDIDWDAVDYSDPQVAAFVQARQDEFSMLPTDTVEAVLQEYADVAQETDRILSGLDLDSSHELPAAPWFEPGARWTVRRVILHLIAETSQHGGHADILRESIDGRKAMG